MVCAAVSPPRRLCITRWRVDVVVEDMARHFLCVDEPQVLLYLDDVKITPSNLRKAKPRASVMDEAVQFGPDGVAENILGHCSKHSRHVDGWTIADYAAVGRHEAMVVSSALAEASNTIVLTKPGVLDQSVCDSGERGSDGAQDLLLKHLQEAEVNEECASESACAADEDLRWAWEESFEMSVAAVLWSLDSQVAAPALGEEPIRGNLMNVSLVAEFYEEFRKRRATFVNWKRYRVQRQTVETDESDRLIFSRALRHQCRALELAQVLVPDCGVVMEKVKKGRRVC